MSPMPQQEIREEQTMKAAEEMTPEEIKMVQHAIEFAKYVNRQGYHLLTDDGYVSCWIKDGEGAKTVRSIELYEQFLDRYLSDMERYKKGLIAELKKSYTKMVNVDCQWAGGVYEAIQTIENFKLPTE
jgi:hypothetical protein